MNPIFANSWPLSETIVERLGWVLVHSLWQFTLVALLAGSIVHMLRQRSAATRYTLLTFALAVTVSAPILTWTWLPAELNPAEEVANRSTQVAPTSGSPENLAADPTAIAEKTGARARSTDAVNGAAIAGEFAADTTSVTNPQLGNRRAVVDTAFPVGWSDKLKSTLQPWLAWIVAVWGLGVMFCSLRPLLGWYTLRRLQREGLLPVSADIEAALGRIAQRLGMRQGVRVLQSTLAQVPVVVGYLRPAVLLPVSLLTNIPPAQLEAILAHELAHVRRHDFIVNLLQTLVETLCFYHPAVWWISHRIRVEREHCCDDLVVSALGNRVEYGRALLAVAELHGRATLLAPGATDGSLVSRIRRIAVGPVNDSRRFTWLGASLLTIVFLVMGYAASASISGKATAVEHPFRAILPDGSTVELLGVTADGIDPARWWSPDGKPLKGHPFSGFKVTAQPDWGDRRRFAFRSTGSRRVAWFFPGNGQYQSSAVGNDTPEIWREEVASPLKLPSLERANIQCGIGEGDFGPWVTVAHDGTRQALPALPPLLEFHYERVAGIRVEGEAANTRLKLPPYNFDLDRSILDRDWVVVTKDQNRLAASQVDYGSNPPTVTFNTPIDAVDHIEFRLRTYRYLVAFQNVSLQAGQRTEFSVAVGPPAQPRNERKEPRFAAEVTLKLKRSESHAGRWFFIDLDQGRLAKPPFEVEIDTERLPYFVLKPQEAELNAWLMREGVDLILRSEPQAAGDGSGKLTQKIQIRSVRTNLKSSGNGLQQAADQSWTWKTQPAEIVDQFARKDAATHVSGFVPNSSNGDLRPDSPQLQNFRTAQNVLGLFLLEQPQAAQDELTLRIAHIADAATPLADVQFAGDEVVSGKDGPAIPPGLATPVATAVPGGLTVELVGITRNTAPTRTGWRPNGLPLGDIGYWPSTNVLHDQNSSSAYPENGPHPVPDANAIDYLFRFRGLKSQPSITFDLSSQGTSYHNNPLQNPYEIRVSSRRREAPPPGSSWTIPDGEMHIGITDEPWGRYVKIGTDGTVINPLLADELYHPTYALIKAVGTQPHTRVPTGKAVVLRVPQSQTDPDNPLHRYAFEFRAIDNEGHAHWALEWEGRGIEGTKWNTAQWGLAQALPEGRTLSHYEYRLRPYRHWVTLTGVSLQPGKESAVQISVKSLPIVEPPKTSAITPGARPATARDAPSLKEYGPQDWAGWFVNAVAYRRSPDQTYPPLAFKHLRAKAAEELALDANAAGAAEARAWLEQTTADRSWTGAEFTSQVARIGEWKLSVIQRALGAEEVASRSFPKPGRAAKEGELSGFSFGPPAKNGLRVAWILDPVQKEYAVGETLKCRVLFHNSGVQAVQFAARDIQDGTWTVRDAAGKPVPTEAIPLSSVWLYPRLGDYQRYRLEPGQVMEVAGQGVGIGEGDHSAARTQIPIWRIIKAAAGTEVQIYVETKLDINLAVDEFPEEKSRDWTGSLRSGDLKFNVVAPVATVLKLPDAASVDAQGMRIRDWPAILVDGKTDQPLEGITVSVRGHKQGVVGPQLITLKSDGQGQIKVPLAKGSGTTLDITAPGWWCPNFPYIGERPPGMGRAETSTIDDPIQPIRIQLWKGTHITGKFLLPDGQPAAGIGLHAGVYLFNHPWADGPEEKLVFNSWDHGDWPNWNAYVVTKSDGSFETTVPGAESRSWVRVGTTSSGFGAIDPTGLDPNGPDKGILQFAPFETEVAGSENNPSPEAQGKLDFGTMQLQRGTVLRGRVVNADGQPVPGVPLLTSGKHGPYAGRRTVSGENGEFAFLPMSTGRFTLSVDARLRDAQHEINSRDVQAVFVSQEIILSASDEPQEIVVRAEPHVTMEFEWVDRRAKKGPVSYYGEFTVDGRVPRAGGTPVWWRGETEKIERDGREFLIVKVPRSITEAQLNLPSDQVVTAAYEDEFTKSGPGQIPLGDVNIKRRRIIFGDEPQPKK